MKANLFKSYRMQMMYYTLLSGAITVCIDFLFLFITSKIMLLVKKASRVSSDLQEKAAESFAGNFHNVPQSTSPADNSIVNSLSGNAFHGQGVKLFGQSFHWGTVILVAFISVVIFVLIFHFMTRKMTRYIEEITASIQRIAQGDFSTKVEVKYENEFAIIAQNLNIMAKDLYELKEKEHEAENTKNELITNVAHDLRTPLTSIIGYLDILNCSPDLGEDNKKKYIQIAYDKSKRLEKLINDLFSFTKLAYGNMPIKTTLIDIVKLLEQQIDEFYPNFEEHNLVCEFKAYTPSAMVLADGEMIARAFENLITNAIKYGKDGKIIKVVTKKAGDDIKVTVINYGTIIPKEDIPYIFDRFYRVEQSRQESTGGTGLGLSIAKSIIEKHGGRITAHSSMAGTAFDVYLKIAK